MNEIDEIKERINIVDLVSQYLTLQKAGVNYKAQCPFHQEKTPSFMVSPEKQFFHCFGCAESGDIFSFVMKMENLNFSEALQMLADRAGVMLPQFKKTKAEYKKETDLKSAIYKINNTSALVFNKILKDSKTAQKARDYLKKRKINEKIIDKFKIGYAPRGGVLAQFLIKRGFDQSQIKQSGAPDRFYDRIIFPIFDTIGNVVGFTGRTLSDEIQPKYLNTPESVIFHKSSVLFGLNFAKDAIKKEKFVIVMEGQMDVVLSNEAGVENVVASSGTALTAKHLLILFRYTPNIAFCFDTDEAGATAQGKAIKLAYENEISPYVIVLPEGFKDVGEIVEKDPKIWRDMAKKKLPAMEWLIQDSFAAIKSLNTDNKKAITKQLIPYLAAISDPLENNHYKKIISQKLGIAERILDEILARYKSKLKPKKSTFAEASGDEQINKEITQEELLVGLAFANTEFVEILAGNLTDANFKEEDVKSIYNLLIDCYNTDKEKVYDCFKSKISPDLEKKVKFLSICAENEFNDLREEEIKGEFLNLVARIKEKKNKKIKSDYAALIAQAEGQKDRTKVKELIKKFQEEISKK